MSKNVTTTFFMYTYSWIVRPKGSSFKEPTVAFLLQRWENTQREEFFSQPLPKAGRELHIDRMMEGGMMQGGGGPLAKNHRSPGRVSTHRLCTCFGLVHLVGAQNMR